LEEGNTLNGGRGGRRFVRKTDKKGGRYSLESTVRAEKRGGHNKRSAYGGSRRRGAASSAVGLVWGERRSGKCQFGSRNERLVEVKPAEVLARARANVVGLAEGLEGREWGVVREK